MRLSISIAVCLYLLYIAYVDLKTKKIYNKSLVPLAILGVLYSVFFSADMMLSFKGFAFGGIFFIVMYVLSKGNVGEGDIKLVAILGLFLGLYKTMIFIFLACVLQVIFFMVRKVGFKETAPFGPSLCISAIFSFFWGYEIFLNFF